MKTAQELSARALRSNHSLFEESPSMGRLIESSVGLDRPVCVNGLQGLSLLYFAFSAALRGARETVLALPGREDMLQAADQLDQIAAASGANEELDVLIFDDYDVPDLEARAAAEQKKADRAKVLKRILGGESEGRRALICTTPDALCRRVMDPERWRSFGVELRTGAEFSFEGLVRAASDLGYQRRPQALKPGEFSVRGGLIDVFAPSDRRPRRIEFFGDEVESIRAFDPASQVSSGKFARWTLFPAWEVALPWRGGGLEVLKEDHAELARRGVYFNGLALYPGALGAGVPFVDHLKPGSLIVADFNRASESLRLRLAELEEWAEKNGYPDPPGLIDNIYDRAPDLTRRDRKTLFLNGFTDEIAGAETRRAAVKSLPPLPPGLDGIAELLRRESRRGLVSIVSRYKSRLDHFLDGEEIGGVLTFEGALRGGFMLEADGRFFFTDADMFHRPRPELGSAVAKAKRPLKSPEEIKVGDYVVHADHGPAVYEGAVTQTVAGGVKRDFFSLRYGKGDQLFVPVEQLDRLEKYVGMDGAAPKIYPLHSGRWSAVKRRVRKKVEDIAAALYSLYRERENGKGFAFSPDNLFLHDLEESFPFEPTEDQLQAFRDVKEDMEKPAPMDRMIYGDVGYGKTEVAVRAAFKAALDKKQSAVLAPTTLLAEQHERTFRERFARFPVRIASLSRFRSKKEQKDILAALAKGEIDVVVGTHRLLSPDVAFKDLGVLIIDEEQRFGVKHKERIKMLKSSVDTLTLTATPIPRTLNMSLIGLRDTSLIETPPEDRKAVKTFVEPWSAERIVEAVRRETARGGQVYFVHNDIATLPRVEAFLRERVPDAGVATVHGKMRERDVERAMAEFLERKSGILLCTTIIENGLDMPNVNTLVVNAAENFGLSQLYQLRGRVGRSYRQSYAYLFFTPLKDLNDKAKQRLDAIRDFAELGSGYKLAMKDLQIRGAGNLLGKEQSGQIAEVGFTLYCQMLTETVARLKGTPIDRIPPPEIEIPIDAFLSEEYIPDQGQRTAAYKNLLEAESPSRVEEIEAEMRDRWGAPPWPAANFLLIARLRALAARLKIAAVRDVLKTEALDLTFRDPAAAKKFRTLPFPADFQLGPNFFDEKIRLDHDGIPPLDAAIQLKNYLELAFKRLPFG